MKKESFFRSFNSIFFLCFILKGEEIKDLLFDNVYKYFNKLFSFQISAVVEMNIFPTPGITLNPQMFQGKIKLKYIVNGNKFRNEITFFDVNLKKDVNKILCCVYSN